VRGLVDVELVLIEVLLGSYFGSIAGKNSTESYRELVLSRGAIKRVRLMRPVPVTGTLQALGEPI